MEKICILPNQRVKKSVYTDKISTSGRSASTSTPKSATAPGLLDLFSLDKQSSLQLAVLVLIHCLFLFRHSLLHLFALLFTLSCLCFYTRHCLFFWFYTLFLIFLFFLISFAFSSHLLGNLLNPLSHLARSILSNLPNPLSHLARSILSNLPNPLSPLARSILSNLPNPLSPLARSILSNLPNPLSPLARSILSDLPNALSPLARSILSNLPNPLSHLARSILSNLPNPLSPLARSLVYMEPIVSVFPAGFRLSIYPIDAFPFSLALFTWFTLWQLLFSPFY